MKKIAALMILVVVLFVMVGYAVFHFGSNLATDKVMESVNTELDTNGQRGELQAYIESDPALRQYVEDAKNADEGSLPFTTKEEATRVLIRKVGVSELQSIQAQAEQGTINEAEVIAQLEKNLTEEELTALKVIAYKEIYNQ